MLKHKLSDTRNLCLGVVGYPYHTNTFANRLEKCCSVLQYFEEIANPTPIAIPVFAITGRLTLPAKRVKKIIEGG